jgi:hypothetical protein
MASCCWSGGSRSRPTSKAIGSRLLEAVEQRGAESGCRRAELFTGSLSTQNISLYESLGYRESARIDQGDGTAQVFLQKDLAVEDAGRGDISTAPADRLRQNTSPMSHPSSPSS